MFRPEQGFFLRSVIHSLLQCPLLFLSEADDLLTICFLAHLSAHFRRALLTTFTTTREVAHSISTNITNGLPLA
jgi:hypothetical protein